MPGRHLQGQKQEECLHAVEAPIYKVSHEEVICLRAIPADLEQLHEVEELPMDVATCPLSQITSLATLYN